MTTDRAAILPAETAEYVLPAPPRAAGEVVVVAPRPDLAASLRRGGEVARVLGERFVSLAEGQQSFLTELRDRLAALDGSVAEASRAQWKGAVRDALSVLDWCDAVQAELLRESRLAAAGAQPVAVVSLCEEVAAHIATADQPVIVTGTCANAWWGSAIALAEIVRCGLGLLSERTQGVGVRSLEVGSVDGAIHLRLASLGEPGDGVDAETVHRFRRATGELGASVRPDTMGPGGASMVIELPASAS